GGNSTFTVDAYPEARFAGIVTQVRNAATTVSNVVTYTVVVGVDNSDLRLKPGMTASVTFITATKADALNIPTAALRFRPKTDTAEAALKLKPGEKRLYVLTDGKPAPVAVAIGIGNDKETEVTGGLAPDALVVLESLGQTTGKASASASPLGMSRNVGPR
ncbi:MAG: efflux RND transporter periplasmic adaptor subunit, partial [Humidesulfovibrio sp.]|nr:efflux RND transporter periplasmic adaptor subunit [Humidesulfovibrio sp.]